MQTKSRFSSAGLDGISLILFLILASSTTSSAPVQRNQLMINETQITTNGADQIKPEIYGDRIVWVDWCNESLEIHIYNLSTSKEIPIPINGTIPYNPVIYGDWIFWGDLMPNNADSDGNSYLLPVIYMYDLSTSKQTHISTSEAAMSPAIYGDKGSSQNNVINSPYSLV